jgi:hypothetical protein
MFKNLSIDPHAFVKRAASPRRHLKTKTPP